MATQLNSVLMIHPSAAETVTVNSAAITLSETMEIAPTTGLLPTGVGALITAGYVKAGAIKAMLFILNVSAVSGTTPTLTAQLQGQDPVSGTWFNVPSAVTVSITGAGVNVMLVGPGVDRVANQQIPFVLPPVFRFVYTIGGTTPSFTFSHVAILYEI